MSAAAANQAPSLDQGGAQFDREDWVPLVNPAQALINRGRRDLANLGEHLGRLESPSMSGNQVGQNDLPDITQDLPTPAGANGGNGRQRHNSRGQQAQDAAVEVDPPYRGDMGGPAPDERRRQAVLIRAWHSIGRTAVGLVAGAVHGRAAGRQMREDFWERGADARANADQNVGRWRRALADWRHDFGYNYRESQRIAEVRSRQYRNQLGGHYHIGANELERRPNPNPARRPNGARHPLASDGLHGSGSPVVLPQYGGPNATDIDGQRATPANGVEFVNGHSPFSSHAQRVEAAYRQQQAALRSDNGGAHSTLPDDDPQTRRSQAQDADTARQPRSADPLDRSKPAVLAAMDEFNHLPRNVQESVDPVAWVMNKAENMPNHISGQIAMARMARRMSGLAESRYNTQAWNELIANPRLLNGMTPQDWVLEQSIYLASRPSTAEAREAENRAISETRTAIRHDIERRDIQQIARRAHAEQIVRRMEPIAQILHTQLLRPQPISKRVNPATINNARDYAQQALGHVLENLASSNEPNPFNSPDARQNAINMNRAINAITYAAIERRLAMWRQDLSPSQNETEFALNSEALLAAIQQEVIGRPLD